MLLALNVFTVLFTASVLRVDAVASTRHLLLGRNELPGQPSISAGAGANAGNHTAYNNPFAAITPSTSFKWVPCFQEVGAVKNVTYECARFQVPFNYSSPQKPDKFSLAVVRVLATDKANYKGPVFVNFGGPGEPGATTLVDKTMELQQVLGPNYDIVSWDPRGVGSTLPTVSCFATDEAADLWHKHRSQFVVFAANDSLVQLDALNSVLAMNCADNAGHLIPYIGTVNVARDLHRMMVAYGYSKKLTYIGFSYGTTLGVTFAALYPKRIKRMILDGNNNPTGVYKQNFNPESYADAGLVLDEFFHLCHLAGPARCAFWAVSPAAIRDAFWALDARIHTAPVPSRAGVLNWSLWHAGVFRQLYYPLTGWDAPDGPAVLAASLANGSFSAQPAPGAGGNVSSSGATTAVSAVTPLVDPQTGRRNGKEIIMLVQCADAPPYSIRDVRDYEGMLRRSEELGPFVPDGVASDGLVCGRLDTTKAERFRGSFTKIKTSFPILFASSRLDPVTPLRNAVNASAGFVGSAIIVQNVTGHTALKSASACLVDHMGAYLQRGVLPANGTLCQPDALPFGLLPDGSLAPLPNGTATAAATGAGTTATTT